jgi:hypothetical protein
MDSSVRTTRSIVRRDPEESSERAIGIRVWLLYSMKREHASRRLGVEGGGPVLKIQPGPLVFARRARAQRGQKDLSRLSGSTRMPQLRA